VRFLVKVDKQLLPFGVFGAFVCRKRFLTLFPKRVFCFTNRSWANNSCIKFLTQLGKVIRLSAARSSKFRRLLLRYFNYMRQDSLGMQFAVRQRKQRRVGFVGFFWYKFRNRKSRQVTGLSRRIRHNVLQMGLISKVVARNVLFPFAMALHYLAFRPGVPLSLFLSLGPRRFAGLSFSRVDSIPCFEFDSVFANSVVSVSNCFFELFKPPQAVETSKGSVRSGQFSAKFVFSSAFSRRFGFSSLLYSVNRRKRNLLSKLRVLIRRVGFTSLLGLKQPQVVGLPAEPLSSSGSAFFENFIELASRSILVFKPLSFTHFRIFEAFGCVLRYQTKHLFSFVHFWFYFFMGKKPWRRARRLRQFFYSYKLFRLSRGASTLTKKRTRRRSFRRLWRHFFKRAAPRSFKRKGRQKNLRVRKRRKNLIFFGKSLTTRWRKSRTIGVVRSNKRRFVRRRVWLVFNFQRLFDVRVFKQVSLLSSAQRVPTAFPGRVVGWVKSYWNRLKRTKRFFLGQKLKESRRLAVICFRVTINNFFVSVLNLKGRLFVAWSSGSLGLLGPAKQSSVALGRLMRAVLKFSVANNSRNFNVCLVSSPLNQSTKKFLGLVLGSVLSIRSVLFLGAVPHNGVRQKRRKRR